MIASPHPWVDASSAPLFVWRLPARASDQEVQSFLQFWENLVRQQRRSYGLAVDLSEVAEATPSQRRLFGEFNERITDFASRYCVGVAFVAPSPWKRGVITAIHWVTPPPYPHQTFASLSEGRAWVASQLASHRASP